MIELDLGMLTTVLGVLATLGGVAAAVYRITARFARMEQKIEQAGKLHRVLAEGLYACLDGLHQQGCNGQVTKALGTLHAHLFEAIDTE